MHGDKEMIFGSPVHKECELKLNSSESLFEYDRFTSGADFAGFRKATGQLDGHIGGGHLLRGSGSILPRVLYFALDRTY